MVALKAAQQSENQRGRHDHHCANLERRRRAEGERRHGAEPATNERHRRHGAPRCRVISESGSRGSSSRRSRVVELLCERLDQVERGDHQHHARQDEQRRASRSTRRRREGPAARPMTSVPAIRARRPVQQALPIAPPDRVPMQSRRSRSRSQGRRRGLSEASWRRSNTTERTSWIEAEKRSSAVSWARRRAASSDRPPTRSRPSRPGRRARARPRAAASQAVAPLCSGRVASTPSIVAGELFTPSRRSASVQAKSMVPIVPAGSWPQPPAGGD